MSIINYLQAHHHDLVTPDGIVTRLEEKGPDKAEVSVFIDNISPTFVGFEIESQYVFFNIKSTLAQLGVEGIGKSYYLDKTHGAAEITVELTGFGEVGKAMLKEIKVGANIGKLFAKDPRRRVRDPDYLARMFGRADRKGRPLLSLGGLQGSEDLILDRVNGRTVAYLTLQNGRFKWDSSILGLLPTLGKALISNLTVRSLLRLHQEWHPYLPHNITENEILLVRTLPLHIRTVFGCVVNELLSPGYEHTTACILQPDTMHSGDIYELYGKSSRELTDIPLEFYTLEPYREHVFFSDRDQLQACLEEGSPLFDAFKNSPEPKDWNAAVFLVKSEQLKNLKEDDWIHREIRLQTFPGLSQSFRQALMVDRYIEQQAAFPFLKAIEEGRITSQGILLTRYFPSPLMKRMFLSSLVQQGLKRIYFQYPSHSYGDFFSAEDRALLQDLHKFAIPVFWVDESSGKILQYVQKEGRDSGMFVPLSQIDTFLKATMFGIYGSNILEKGFEEDLKELLTGLLEMRASMNHPLMKKEIPLALVTGGGPGLMEIGNKVAKQKGILSCANIVDFRYKDPVAFREQKQNPFIDAKMTYRLDKLVERQAEFNLDFPIFLSGGIGTDFEFCLEEVRRKVGAVEPTPVLLFGSETYWREKITSRFNCNLQSGTIRGSEWLSNCYYVAKNAKEGLEVYKRYFIGTLPCGKNFPPAKDGFLLAKDLFLDSQDSQPSS